MKAGRLLMAGTVLVLMLEFIFLMLAHAADTPGDGLDDMAYVPHMIWALSLSFVSFFTLLFGLIFVILKGSIREHLLILAMWLINFLLPVAAYYVFFQ